MTDPRPPRPSISPARRARIFEAHGGRCHICGERILAGEPWEVEHRIARALTYDDSDENLAPAHKEGACHAAKTKDDVRRIAKAKAQGGETGQWARRQKNGPKLKSGAKLQSRGFEKGGPKRKIPSRPFPSRK